MKHLISQLKTNKLNRPLFIALNNVFRFKLKLKLNIAVFGLSALFILSGQQMASAQIPGSLDLSFGNGGKVVTPVATANLSRVSTAEATAVQADGKIVVVGSAQMAQTVSYDFAVVRYNTDGSLDTTFDGDGIATTDFRTNFTTYGHAADTARAVTIQPDGKIVVVGVTSVGSIVAPPSGNSDFAVARYNTDGSLDTSFDGDGKATVDFGPSEGATAVAIQPDGKIVVSGQVGGFVPNTGVGLVRYNTNGSLDTSFDGDGKLLTQNSPNTSVSAFAMAIQSDGKIFVAGPDYYNGVSPSVRFALYKYNTDGSLDTSFDGDGKVITIIGDAGIALTVGIQPDGKIIVAGAGSSAQARGFALVRYNTNGSLDTSFDGDGIAITEFGADVAVQAISIQSNGKIVAAGPTALARYNANGSLDVSFDGDGKVLFPVPENIFPYAVAFQSEGKIVVAGDARITVNGINHTDFAVLRYIGNTNISRQPLFDFDGDGKTDLSIFRRAVGEWWYLKSGDNSDRAFQFGNIQSDIVPADYTGDGKTDIAFWRRQTGEWFILRSEDSSFYSFPFGKEGDLATSGDFDGDGKADPTIFRPSTAAWYILRSSGGVTIQQFGAKDDVIVPSDYDGDGKADLAIFRRSVGQWWYLRSSDQTTRAFQFGSSSDHIVPADYTGDGKTDIAVWRPQTGEWFILRSEDNSYYSVPFGRLQDIPVPGDYDGDGKADLAVWRPTDRSWYIAKSSGGYSILQFGAEGDEPVAATAVKESVTFTANLF